MQPEIYWRGFPPYPTYRGSPGADLEYRLPASPECLNISSCSPGCFLFPLSSPPDALPHANFAHSKSRFLRLPLVLLPYQPDPPLVVSIPTTDT